MKKAVFVLICVLMLGGCVQNVQTTAANSAYATPEATLPPLPTRSHAPEGVPDSSDKDSLDRYELEARELEVAYLERHKDRDLKALCAHLNIMRLNKPEFFEMVRTYFPLLFERFTPDDMFDVSDYGFDEFYAIYVWALYMEDSSCLKTAYYVYKEKAENVYRYAYWLYMNFMDLESGQAADDGNWLYDEALALYGQAKREGEVYPDMFYAFGCFAHICEETGREVDPAVVEEMQAYMEEYAKSYDEEQAIADMLAENLEKAAKYEAVYRETGEEEDLRALCKFLLYRDYDSAEYRHMVLLYYPEFFMRTVSSEIQDVDYGKDIFFAVYVSVNFAEYGLDRFKINYTSYKDFSESEYYYASVIFSDILQFPHIPDEAYSFLYEEAAALLEQAKNNNTDYTNRLYAYSCIIETCKAMGRDEEAAQYEIEKDAYINEVFGHGNAASAA